MRIYIACNPDNSIITPEREPKAGEWSRVTDSENTKFVKYCQHVDRTPKKTVEPITLTVTLDKYQCKIGEEVNYTIEFSKPLSVDDIVPISVTDRQGKHITNIGCTITDGKASGLFSMPVAGDFTVTNESINFHKISIDSQLEIANEFWLRVYQ